MAPQLHWIPAVRSFSESTFHVLPLVIASTHLISMERYTSELFRETTCFWSHSIENELSLADCTFITNQNDCMRDGKNIVSQDIVQITPKPVKGKHSVDAEMNADSFELLPMDQNGLCGTIFESFHKDTSIPYWEVRQANTSPLVLHTLWVCSWTLASQCSCAELMRLLMRLKMRLSSSELFWMWHYLKCTLFLNVAWFEMHFVSEYAIIWHTFCFWMWYYLTHTLFLNVVLSETRFVFECGIIRHALCFWMWYYLTCTLFLNVVLFDMHFVSECGIIRHALCLSMWYYLTCTLFLNVVLFNMHFVSECGIIWHALCFWMWYY